MFSFVTPKNITIGYAVAVFIASLWLSTLSKNGWGGAVFIFCAVGYLGALFYVTSILPSLKAWTIRSIIAETGLHDAQTLTNHARDYYHDLSRDPEKIRRQAEANLNQLSYFELDDPVKISYATQDQQMLGHARRFGRYRSRRRRATEDLMIMKHKKQMIERFNLWDFIFHVDQHPRAKQSHQRPNPNGARIPDFVKKGRHE